MMMDQHLFADAVARFATGVTVITTRIGDAVHGMTANAFTSLSLSPMQIIICVAKKAKMAEALMPNQLFTVNVLRADQDLLSTCFAGVKLENPPEVQFTDWEGGVRLSESLAAIGCMVATVNDGGDHWIVIGTVCAIDISDESAEPLLYYRRKYAYLEPTRTEAPARFDWEEGTPVMFYDPW